MTRETRIGLLVGLAFIVAFGLILSELTAPERETAREASGSDESAYAWRSAVTEQAPLVEDQPVEYIPAMLEEAPAPAPPAQVVAHASIEENRSEQSPMSPETPGREATPAELRTSMPAPSPAPAQRRRTYVVRANDSLIKIARKVYGPEHGGEYKRIFAANRNILADEATVLPGQRLVIPPLARRSPMRTAEQSAAAPRRYVEMDLGQLRRRFGTSGGNSTRRRVYVVRRGDNLTTIARRTLNDDSTSAVMKIFNANRDKLRRPDRLPIGVELTIPG